VETYEGDASFELVVTDWGSTDADVKAVVKENLKGTIPAKVIQVPPDTPRYKHVIDRGFGRQLAADSAKNDNLIFLDADMVLSRGFLFECAEHLKRGLAYYPIVFYCTDTSNRRGVFDRNGSGNCALTKKILNDVCGWPRLPKYPVFHGQDKVLRDTVQKACGISHKRSYDIYHQYHPGRAVDRYAAKRVPMQDMPESMAAWDRQVKDLVRK